MAARALARLIDAESGRSEWREPGWQQCWPMSRAGGESQDDSTARPKEAHPEERRHAASGCRTPKAIPDAEETGSGSIPSGVPGIGEAPCGQGEDLL